MSKISIILLLVLILGIIPVQAKNAKLNIITFVTSDDIIIFKNSRKELNQMEKYGSTDDIGLFYEVSEWPNAQPNPDENGWLKRGNFPSDYNENHRWRYKVTKDTGDSKDEDCISYKNKVFSTPITKNIPYKKDEIHKNLISFLRWVHINYPADMYMLILKGHGNGSMGGTGHVKNADISLALQKLAEYTTEALKETDKELSERLKIITFSSCLMQSMGTAYQCSYNNVDSILASPVSTYGMDYELFLKALHNKLDGWVWDDDPSVQNISEAVIEAFNDYVKSLNYKSMPIAAVNAKKIRSERGTNKDIKKLVNNFVKSFMSSVGSKEIEEEGDVKGNEYWNAIRHIMAQVQKYDRGLYSVFVDMDDFFTLVSKDPVFNGTDIQKAADAILNQLTSANNDFDTSKIIMKYKVYNATVKDNRKYLDKVEMEHAKGLSILMPPDIMYVVTAKNGKTLGNVAAAFKNKQPETVLQQTNGKLNLRVYGFSGLTKKFKNLDFVKTSDNNNWYKFIEAYNKYSKNYVTNIGDRIVLKFKELKRSSSDSKFDWWGHINGEKHSGISHKKWFHPDDEE